MTINQSNIIKNSGERGTHNKYDWKKEARSKRRSAIRLREFASQTYQNFLDEQSTNLEQKPRNRVLDLLSERESLNKDSFLLIGYAIELLLKSAFLSLLIYAPKSLVEKNFEVYGHKLRKIAESLHLDLTESELILLEILGSYIVRETRYPVTSNSVDDYCSKSNDISVYINEASNFQIALSLYNKIETFLEGSDGTTNNIKIHGRLSFEKDGYAIYRVGGNFPPVIVIRYSSKQIQAKEDTPEHVREIMKNYSDEGWCMNTRIFLKYWDKTLVFKVVKDRTIEDVTPPSK
ncbi:hypothetical protein [Vibrio parahaemolyticus]|uniref:hypothetical protein n=1 Tax=Vibrio parahaemolyticus TaxID=670 RepID=UPI001E5733AF|nr:hypothetical protein [Vibrio parahaemolyticus]HCE2124829.1 hypothetical protein [Vibrio parahaemolyticus]